MAYQAASDASFYALLHYVLEAKKRAEVTIDRRFDERQAFTSLQFVAPYRDGRLPSENQFEFVLCKDLSPGGLTFVSAQRPDSEYMVVALGNDPPIFLSAAVLRHEPIKLGLHRLTMVTVRFIARIKDPRYPTLTAEPPPYAALYLNPD